MNIFDCFVLFLLIAFALNGFSNGFVEEIQSLFSIIIAIMFSGRIVYLILPHIEGMILDTILARILAFILVYMGLNFLISLLSPLILTIITNTLNNILGVCVGIFKALFICAFIQGNVGNFLPENSTLFKDSIAFPYLESYAKLEKTIYKRIQ